MNMARHVACMREKQGAYRVLMGNPEEGDHLEDLGTGEDNVIMDHKKLGWEYMYWINPAQNWGKWWFVVNTVIEHAVPIKYREFLE